MASEPDDERRPTTAEDRRAAYRDGLPDHHDPTAGFDGSTPAQSALTLRAVLAAFGLITGVVGAVLVFRVPQVSAFGWAFVVIAAIALVDLAWVLYRKGRGEPG